MDPSYWLGEVAAGYANLTMPEKKSIKDFTLLWSLFEGKMLDYRASAAAIVDAMTNLQNGGVLDVEGLAPSFRYWSDRFLDGAEVTMHFEGLHFRGNDQRPLVEGVLTGVIDNPASIASAMLIIVYRLRNNLFHGIKWDDGIHDQRGNFKAANAVLMAVMDMHRALPNQ